MRVSDKPTFSSVTFDVEKYAAQMNISPEMLRFSVAQDGIWGEVCARLVRQVATIKAKDHVSVPATWWDALKEAEAKRSPIMRWWVRRSPVRHQVYRARALFPEVIVPSGGRRQLEVVYYDISRDWLAEEQP